MLLMDVAFAVKSVCTLSSAISCAFTKLTAVSRVRLYSLQSSLVLVAWFVTPMTILSRLILSEMSSGSKVTVFVSLSTSSGNKVVALLCL